MDEFSRVVSGRIRIERSMRNVIRNQKSSISFSVKAGQSQPSNGQQQQHTLGQSDCFCHQCLVYRQEDWRIGNVNRRVSGPRNQGLVYTWGNNERSAAGFPGAEVEGLSSIHEPRVMPSIIETLQVGHSDDDFDSQTPPLSIERSAKVTLVAGGKFHTLFATESSKVFAVGDHGYGALGISETNTSGVDHGHHHAPQVQKNTLARPCFSEAQEVALKIPTEARITQLTAGGFSSYCIVDSRDSNNGSSSSSTTQLMAAKTQMTRAEEFAAKSGPGPSQELAQKMIKAAKTNLTKILKQIKLEKAETCYVYSWGRNARGALGQGHPTTSSHSSVPMRIEALAGLRVLQLEAGLSHVVLRTEMSGVFAFGNGDNGRLGFGGSNEDKEDALEPRSVSFFQNLSVISVGAGDEHSVAIVGQALEDRQVFVWGKGQDGRLGLGHERDMRLPTRCGTLRGKHIVQLACGGAHTLALTANASVWSFGQGTYGQLGRGDTYSSLMPQLVRDIPKIVELRAGTRHSLALTQDGQQGKVFGWGLGIHGSTRIHKVDPSTYITVLPTAIQSLPLFLVNMVAAHDRTFVWGDACFYGEKEKASEESSSEAANEACSVVAAGPSFRSDNLRVVYSCHTCDFETVCPVCAHRCHYTHCIELRCDDVNPLSRACHCHESGQCRSSKNDEPSM